MQKWLFTKICILLLFQISNAQEEFDIRFDLDTVNCQTQIVCYNVQIKGTTQNFGLAGQNYRIFYDASKAAYLSGVSLLPSSYTSYTLVQNVVGNASGIGSLPFESTLGFLNYTMDLNDIQNGGVSLNNVNWTTTTNLCFTILMDSLNNPNTCLDFVWARSGLTDPYASAFVEISQWVGPNNTIPAVGFNYDDLGMNDGNSACFNISCADPPDTEDTIPKCTDGIDNDGDGLVDCEDPDCIAIPTLDCDGDGTPNGEDCEPTNPLIYPGALCNDNNPNTINDAYTNQCNCLGTPINGEVDIRFNYVSYDCPTNTVCYDVQLRNITGRQFNLAGQNYRLYFDGSTLTYLSGQSFLPTPAFTNFTLVNGFANQDASNVNGPLVYENSLSFLNYYIDLNDTLSGGFILPIDSSWVSTSRLCFTSNTALSSTNIPCIQANWGRDTLTSVYATAFVEIAEWSPMDGISSGVLNTYGDILLSDSTNICNISDCDGDGTPNGPDCAPTDPIIYPGAPCNDNNANTFGDAYNSVCICVGNPIPSGVSITGITFHDLNGNGQSVGDPRLGNVTVSLYGNGGIFINSTTTNSSGVYTFTSVIPGQYYIVFTATNNYLSTFSNLGNDLTDSDITNSIVLGSTDLFTIGSTPVSNIDGGFYICSKVGDLVWYDINKNDIYNSNENGINGLKINIFRNFGGNYVIWASTFTGNKPNSPSDDGYFEFCVPPGQYYIKVELPPLGLVTAQPNKGGNEQNDSDITHSNGAGTTDVFVVSSGQIKDDIGAGYYPMAVAGNLVWIDENYNGIQEDTEQRVNGVIVEAIDAETHLVVGTSVTNEQGLYTIDYLPMKEIYYRFNPPTGYYATQPNNGMDDSDSDVDHSFGLNTTRKIMMYSSVINENIDFGISLGALPLHWLDVYAIPLDKANQIIWKTTGEVNVSHYEIEKKFGSDSKFIKIGEIIASNNPVESINSYKFLDDNIQDKNQNYYRIKQFDFDGKFTYSKIISVGNKNETSISIYPNPVIELLHIELSNSEYEQNVIRVFDIDGKIVENLVVNSQSPFQLITKDYKPGVYFLSISNINEITCLKFIKN